MTLKLNGSSSGYTAIDAPAAAGSNTLVLPTGNGNNKEVLQTNGSGTLSWVKPGTVLQIVANTRNGTYSENIGSTHFWGPADFETKITPSSASNKVLIQGHFCVDGAIAMGVNCQIKKDGSVLAGANGATASNRKLTHSGVKSTGERMVNLPITYLDSPNTTSEVAYKFWFTHTSGSARVVYINQSHEDTDNAEISRAVSTILLTEIAG
jgi:hypothetical protein